MAPPPSTFWKRNRRRIFWSTVGVAAAAGVTYYAYAKWRQVADEFNAYLASILAEDTADRRRRAAASPRSAHHRRQTSTTDPLDRITERSKEGWDSSTHPTSDGEDEEEDLIAQKRRDHFSSIQKIVDGTTVPSLVPHLRARVTALDGVDGIAAKLRERRASAQHATASNGGVTDDSSKRDEKYELWKALTAAAFARAVATAWSLPLLQLFVKAQLNVLGRHLFLESQIKESEVAEAEGGPTFGPGVGLTRDSSTNSFAYELPSKLTLRCQQKFLSYAEFLSQHGIETIVHEARNAATRVLKDVDLRKPCSENHFRGLLARLSATLEDVASTKGWARLLLPQIGGIGGGATGGAQSPTGAWRFLVTQGTELGLTTSVDAVLDEGDLQVLEALLNETRRVLSTRAFDEAVRCSAAQTLRMVGGNAAASVYTVGSTMDPGSERDEMGEMGENGVPAAKLVPAVAAAALRVLDQPGETISAVAALPEVEALCARVYDVTGTVGRW